MSVLASNETIRSRQQRYGGHTTGFDYLRIALAIAVVMHHSLVVTDQPLTEWLWTYWPRGFLATLLPAFFALSGFLVAGSLIKRVSIPAFVAMRLIRVVPALTVEVLADTLGSLGLFHLVAILEVFSQHRRACSIYSAGHVRAEPLSRRDKPVAVDHPLRT
jgi:peptidoglycan/LPS O-acetylase OafA/YrhL